MQRLLLITAVVFLVLAFIWPLVNKLGIGRLPGDFVFGKGSKKIYLPLTTSLILSIIIIIALWIWRK